MASSGTENDVYISDNDALLDDDEPEEPPSQCHSIAEKQSELVNGIVGRDPRFDFENEEIRAQLLAHYEPYLAGGEHGTLIHVALRAGREDKDFECFRSMFSVIIAKYPEILEARDQMGETPLHYAIQRGLFRVTRYLCSRAPAEAAAKALGYRGRDEGTCLHAAIQLHPEVEDIKYLISSCDPSTLTDVDNSGCTPLHYAVRTSRDRNGPSRWKSRRLSVDRPVRSHDTSPQLEVVKLLIERNGRALHRHDNNLRTPYLERVHQIEGGGARYPTADRDPVARFIQLYCLRKFPREEVLKCLYTPGQERHLEFDLSGYPYPTISEDFLDSLSRHLQFECVLKYVALPKLIFEPRGPSREQRRRGGGKDTSLVTVFQWLRRNNVEKIIKVIVVDDEEPSHTDSSIEEALAGFDVEIWDWRKFDLSSEVIFASSPDVEEVSLYSTGSNTALMGWASPEGLPKFANLQAVNIFVRQGQETRSRVERYIQAFNASVARRTEHRVKVRYKFLGEDSSLALASQMNEGHMQAETPWIDCMRTFGQLLCRAPNFKETRAVKIAVIGDGVDPTVRELRGKIAIGRSYHPDSGKEFSPYYIPSSGYGTYMAALICTICPGAMLYIAKLDTMQVDVQSAAQAIQWATSCDVDIISIAWTSSLHESDDEGIATLNAAVYEAGRRGIAIICPADEAIGIRRASYPGGFEDYIVIGAATEDGEPAAPAGPVGAEFLLPGENIPLRSDNEIISDASSGSSSVAAAAAAAGLAGQLLFCSRILSDGAAELRGRDDIRFAFRAMAERNGRFPLVRKFFELPFVRIAEDAGPGWETQQSLTRSDISEMEWDYRCTDALREVMRSLRGR